MNHPSPASVWILLGLPLAIVLVGLVLFLSRWSRLRPRTGAESEELLLGAAVPPTPEALAALTLHLARMPRFFILSGNDLALGLAYVAMGAPTAQALEPQGCRLLEDYLIKRILGGPPTLAATTAFPVLENQEQLRTFLAGRRLPSPSLVSEDASLA